MPSETGARAQQLRPGAATRLTITPFARRYRKARAAVHFLPEYARRNRNADTQPLLTAMKQLQISLAVDQQRLPKCW